MNPNTRRIKIFDLDDVLIGRTKVISDLSVEDMGLFKIAYDQVNKWCKTKKMNYDEIMRELV